MSTYTLFDEMKAIFNDWPIWHMLGMQDIKLRYRCSALGPFWITLHMAITVYTMSFLYGHLFKLPIDQYFPYLTAGLIGWSFISTLLLEGSASLVEAEHYLKNQAIFISLFMMRIIFRNFIILAHNLLVFIPVAFFFSIPIGWNTLLLCPGLLLLGINAFMWGTLLSFITTKYRDFHQIITSFVQIVFFLTPIMWMPSLLPERLQWVTQFNPFNQFLNLIRNPLLNKGLDHYNLLMVCVTTLLGMALYALIVKKYRYRIVFWL